MSKRFWLTAISLCALSTQIPQCQANPGKLRNGLAPATLDSFVHESGALADQIYGDEGVVGLPPFNGFEKENRINAGIFDRRDRGLTTGHGSYLPDAWGYDEFTMPPGEWDQSGARGRQSQLASNYKITPAPRPIQNRGASSTASPSESPAEQPAYDPGPQDRNNPNNLPPGYIGVYQHGVFIGSYDSATTDFPGFLQSSDCLNPRAYQTYLQQTGGSGM